MEEEVGLASAVLCVCNRDFYQEWNQCPSEGKIHVVGILRQLIQASVTEGKSLAKYAVILLEPGDEKFIPSLYLRGEPRRFLISEVEHIARFIQGIPSYVTATSF